MHVVVEISAADALTCGNHHQIFLHNLQIVETVIRINPTGIVKEGQPENFQRREIVLQGYTVTGSDVMDGRQKIMVGRKIQEQLAGRVGDITVPIEEKCTGNQRRSGIYDSLFSGKNRCAGS